MPYCISAPRTPFVVYWSVTPDGDDGDGDVYDDAFLCYNSHRQRHYHMMQQSHDFPVSDYDDRTHHQRGESYLTEACLAICSEVNVYLVTGSVYGGLSLPKSENSVDLIYSLLSPLPQQTWTSLE